MEVTPKTIEDCEEYTDYLEARIEFLFEEIDRVAAIKGRLLAGF